jgi:predicted AlkP superfamily phosphohydrolase/phosphomutase
MPEKRSCVLIGWDGATFDLLLPWMKSGVLPNLASLCARGSARKLRSVIPPVTPAAWTSILSGMNPGKHGILDFNEFNASEYLQKDRLINSTHIAGTTIFDLLSERGLTVSSLQLPLTYPAWKINGLMLAGIPNPDDSLSYTYPPGRDFGPLRPSKMRPDMSYEELFENHCFHIRKLTNICCDEIRQGHDLVAVYFRESDDFHHLYWRLLDPGSPGYDAKEAARIGNPIKSIYEALDASLGQILDASENANYFLISDHGGTAIGVRRFYLNAWLAQQGYLKLNQSFLGSLERLVYTAAKAIRPLFSWYQLQRIQGQLGLGQVAARMRNNTDAVDWESSRAFAVLPCGPTVGIQLNVRGRESRGAVNQGADYERLRTELIEQLKAVKDPGGNRVVVDAFRREEIFTGPYVDRMPDVLVSIDDGITVRTDFGRNVWGTARAAELRDLSGEHDMDGIFAAAGSDIQSTGFLPPASLLDVAPTLLYALEEPVPQSMDGHAMADIFHPDFCAGREPEIGPAREVSVREGQDVYSEEEDAAIRDRLQALGYLDPS